ncbi:sugar ABC transporter substrate-binding protein [Chloroflexi bacterium TSY]|nr:sugar ABC transporter substrate-binding protein [Chloroflexi bacterium TSY]
MQSRFLIGQRANLSALVLVFALVLSSCVAVAPGAAPASEDETIELTWLDVCAPVTTPITDMLIEKFESENPNVTVNVECSQGDYAEGIYAKAAAGNLPDVMFSADLFTVPFVSNNVLLNLEEFAETDDSFTFDDIYPNILGLGQVVGTPGTYMIPASWDSVQMYYNKDMFEGAGADLPTDDWTWDDLIAACQTIQAANDGVNCVAIGGTGGWDWWAYFIPWIVGYGGAPVSEDFTTSTFSSEQSLAGIQAYVNLWTEHEVTVPVGVEVPGGTQGCFIGGNCATFFHIPGLMKTFREQITDFEWDVSVTPAHPVQHATGMGTFGYGVTKDSAHPDLAWDLINDLASRETQGAILRNYGGMPFLKSMADDPIFEEIEPPPANIKAFIRGGGVGIFPPMGYPSKCGSLYAGLINQTIKTALEEAIRGVKTVEEAFGDADAEIQACLDTAG